jgi:hypothetical protein
MAPRLIRKGVSGKHFSGGWCHAHGFAWACEALHPFSQIVPRLESLVHRHRVAILSLMYFTCLTCPPKAVGMARGIVGSEEPGVGDRIAGR